MTSENVYLLKIFYADKKEEEILGIIDYKNNIIKIIEIDEKSKSGFKEKGIINISHVKRVEIIKKAGCLGSESDECK